MIENGFVIQEDLDEIGILRKAYWENKVNGSVLHISIMTTLDCNFRCIYCFEEHRQIYMSKKVHDSIIRFLENNLEQYDALHVDWYGGEPLMNMECINRMSKSIILLCEKFGISYNASITTNGYLLNKTVYESLINDRVTLAQITIDGPRNVHNSRRFTATSFGTFDEMINNIILYKRFIKMNIRINVDRNTIDSVDELLIFLRDKGLSDVRISICGVVSSDANPCEEVELNGDVFAKKIIDKTRLAHQLKLNISTTSLLEMVSPYFCIVDLDAQYIFSPSGGIYKCGESYDSNDPGLVVQLNIDGNMQINDDRRLLWDKDPFQYNECITCKSLPLCMGGCQMKRKIKKHNWCEATLKNNLNELIWLYYNSVLERS